jgi:hypothetical protein
MSKQPKVDSKEKDSKLVINQKKNCSSSDFLAYDCA